MTYYTPVPPIVGSFDVLNIIYIIVNNYQRLLIKLAGISASSVPTQAMNISSHEGFYRLQVGIPIINFLFVLKLAVHRAWVKQHNLAGK